MKNFINNIKSDKLALRGFLLCFILIIATVIYTLIYYSALPPFVPIYNQLPWGNERLLPTIGIFLPTAVFTLIFIFNVIFISVIYSKNPFIARVIAAVSLILALMNFLFIIKTITNIL